MSVSSSNLVNADTAHVYTLICVVDSYMRYRVQQRQLKATVSLTYGSEQAFTSYSTNFFTKVLCTLCTCEHAATPPVNANQPTTP